MTDPARSSGECFREGRTSRVFGGDSEEIRRGGAAAGREGGSMERQTS